MWCTPTHRVKQKRRGSSRKGSKSWCHGLSPVNIVQYASPTHAPSPCVPTTAITKPFSLQGARACWSLGCEGVPRGVCTHATTEGEFKGNEKGTRTKLGVRVGCGLLGNVCRTISSSWGLQSREGERTQRKTLRASDPNNENLRTVASSPFVF